MKTTAIVFGSRTYAPLRDVTAFVESLPVDVTIVAVGSTLVADTAREAATANGRHVTSIPLSTSADELFDAADQDGASVTVFAALDPETKEITDRTGALITMLNERGATVEVRQSILNAAQASRYHRVEVELRKLIETPDARRTYRLKRLTDAGIELWKAHDALMEWMTENDADPTLRSELFRQYLDGDVDQKLVQEVNTGWNQWERNYHRYLVIADLLNDAKTAIADEDYVRAAFRVAA